MSAPMSAKMLSRVAALALVGLIAVALLGATGCATKPTVATEADKKVTCASNQQKIRETMSVFYADSQIYPPIDTVVEKLNVKCPDGGKYLFNEDQVAVTCSVHGSLKPAQ
jgi:uncharacterized lipoprotein YajG